MHLVASLLQYGCELLGGVPAHLDIVRVALCIDVCSGHAFAELAFPVIRVMVDCEASGFTWSSRVAESASFHISFVPPVYSFVRELPFRRRLCF